MSLPLFQLLLYVALSPQGLAKKPPRMCLPRAPQSGLGLSLVFPSSLGPCHSSSSLAVLPFVCLSSSTGPETRHDVPQSPDLLCAAGSDNGVPKFELNSMASLTVLPAGP